MQFIAALHRGGDAYITFHRKSKEGVFENLFRIRAGALESELPRRLRRLSTDASFSINGFSHRANGPDGQPAFISGVQSRRAKNLRYLNAVYVDLDFYKRGDKRKAVWSGIQKLVEEGLLPIPSGSLASRGLWLFWLLHDEKHRHMPPRYKERSFEIWRRVMKAIAVILAPFGADPAVKDPVRLTRIPGSVNSKNNKPVRAALIAATPRTYSLKELRRFFKQNGNLYDRSDSIRRAKVSIRRRARESEERAKHNPWVRVNQTRLKQFRVLEQMRGGFDEGCRNNAAFLYARLMATAQVEHREIRIEVAKMARRCKPALAPSEVRGAIESGTKRKVASIKTETIPDLLGITWQEHDELKKSFGRFAWKAASTANPRPPTKAQLRRVKLEKLLRRKRKRSYRQLALDLEVSPTQIVKDLRALGFNTLDEAYRQGARLF